MQPAHRLWVVLVAALALATAWVRAEDVWQPTEGWFTLHHDAMRSGRTQYSPGVPFEYAWHQEYWDELIGTEAEPIVAEGLVFLGTFAGNLRALDAETGKEVWKLDLGAPIHHSPAYAEGKVFAATMGGKVSAVEAKTGKEAWAFKAEKRGGFVASPAVYKGLVYIGDRAGDLYALDCATGARKWKAELGAMVQQSAALKDGKLALAAEDLVPRLFDAATGKELWKAPQMTGATVRGYYPVFWKDLVIWRTEVYGIDPYHNNITAATEDGKRYQEARQKHGWSKEAEKMIGNLPACYTDEKYKQEQEYIRAQMRDGKHPRSFYALKVADGGEPTLYAVGYHSSENGYSVPASPPIDAEGSLYVFMKSVYSEWPYPIRAFDAVGTLDCAGGLPVLIRGIDRKQGSFPATCDEVNNLTVAGDKLYDTHDHVLAYMELKTRKVFNAYSSHSPELWGGVAKCMAHEKCAQKSPGRWNIRDTSFSLHFAIQWNGPMQGAVAIYKDKVWWNTGSMVVCLKGKVTE
ncbi:MAG: PQQ-binding-like beta-propeller repeat protein [Planctomycetota bacterium]|nr:PQQ-binding-like beta-propeller repeat protein [Planctomycetota bacterium]